MRCLIGAIVEATENALERYSCKVVFSGGVASNSMLRERMKDVAIFCPPQYATDNALGTAVLTWRAYHATGV